MRGAVAKALRRRLRQLAREPLRLTWVNVVLLWLFPTWWMHRIEQRRRRRREAQRVARRRFYRETKRQYARLPKGGQP